MFVPVAFDSKLAMKRKEDFFLCFCSLFIDMMIKATLKSNYADIK